MINPGIKIISIHKNGADHISRSTEDMVAIESPLEMRIAFGSEDARSEQSLSITMRTPGQDEDLTIGFLFTEGIIKSIQDITQVSKIEDDIILVEFTSNLQIDMSKLQRHFYTSSSCGVCGKTSIDLVKTKSNYNPQNSDFSFADNLLWGLQEKLKTKQILFDQTGGIHAAGLFNKNGELILLKEDVGRHNAVDKLIGSALQKDIVPLYDHFIMVSGRASFELIQKASMAGLPMLVAVGAPSSLAIELAEEQGLCLIGFLKHKSCNIYSRPDRITHTIKTV